MTKYFIHRLLSFIPTLIAISIVVFAILALAPGDPMGEFALNPSITADVLYALLDPRVKYTK